MSLTRRSLLISAAPMAMAAAGCTTNPTTGQEEINPSVLDFIQNAVADAAQFIPEATSIVSTAVSLFGPQWAGLVTIGSQAIQTLITTISSVVTSLTPPAQARLRAKLKAVSPTTSVTIGTTSTGVVVIGHRL